MGYLLTKKLDYPVAGYQANSLSFGEAVVHGKTHWGIHLGEDMVLAPDTPILSIGRGRVVYAALHPGSEKKPNWGNVMIIAHKNPKTSTPFFSLYGHLGEMRKQKGESVELGEVIGTIGKSNTPENGWWEAPHLHFSIYVGPWRGSVLPGYFKEGQKRTQMDWWVRPSEMIANYGA
ncbi:M23 family metallopeptidase [Patescibacteria group bacterium]|nr:MAG: M23 family metallopeptidase [Patescibacteria group bacterium]